MATFVVNGRTVTAERNQKLLRFLMLMKMNHRLSKQQDLLPLQMLKG